MTDTTQTTGTTEQPAKRPTREARPAPKPLKPHLQAQIDSEHIIIGTRITALKTAEAEALEYIMTELEAKRPWPTLKQLAERMKVTEKKARAMLDALRDAEKIQVIAWEPYTGTGKRVPAQFR